ncbi:MAG: hypothetical protein P8Z72_05020 [Gammaproteobacteria bacterium]
MIRQRQDNAGSIGPAQAAAELQGWQALNLALDQAMARDDSVFILGEDVGLFGGSYRVTQGLYAKYGEWRVRDTFCSSTPMPRRNFCSRRLDSSDTRWPWTSMEPFWGRSWPHSIRNVWNIP